MGETYVNALEPNSNVGNKRNIFPKLLANLTLVNMICQRVWYQVIREVLDIVLRAGLSACTRIA